MALVLSLGGIYDFLIPFIVLLGTFIPPIGGVIMADFFVGRRGKYPELSEHTTSFNVKGLAKYAIADAAK